MEWEEAREAPKLPVTARGEEAAAFCLAISFNAVIVNFPPLWLDFELVGEEAGPLFAPKELPSDFWVGSVNESNVFCWNITPLAPV